MENLPPWKIERVYFGSAEACRNWTPDNLAIYTGPYDVSWQHPLPSCYRRWQAAKAQAEREQKHCDFVRRCAAVPLVALADADDLARLPLGAANLS